VLSRPYGGRIGPRAPPDAVPKPLGIRFKPQQARRIWKHRARVRLRKPYPVEPLEKLQGFATPHVGIGLPLRGRIPKIAPAVDHLLGRPPADAELQPPFGDQVGRSSVFDHIQWIFIAHVDDPRSDLDAGSPGAYG